MNQSSSSVRMQQICGSFVLATIFTSFERLFVLFHSNLYFYTFHTYFAPCALLTHFTFHQFFHILNLTRNIFLIPNNDVDRSEKLGI